MKHRPGDNRQRWRFGVAIGVILTALWIWAGGYGVFAAPITFRVMSYNIHHGEGLDGKVNLERIARLIRRQGADIVALQEVDRGVKRSAEIDSPAELSRLTGMAFVFSNNFSFQGGQYGNAVLSRFPIMSWTNHHFTVVKAGEQRGFLALTLKLRDKELVLINTHLDFHPDDGERLSSIEEVKTMISKDRGKPLVVCGDFNCQTGSRPYQRLAEILNDAWLLAGQGSGMTIPAKEPDRRIDLIWVSKEHGPKVKRVWVPESEASDHRPVVAELELD